MSRMVLASVRGPRRELRCQLSEETWTTSFSESTLHGRAKTKRPQRHIRTAHVGCWRILAFPFARQSRSVVAALWRWRARFKRDAGSGGRPRSRWPGCCLRPTEGQTSAWSCAPGRRPSGGEEMDKSFESEVLKKRFRFGAVATKGNTRNAQVDETRFTRQLIQLRRFSKRLTWFLHISVRAVVQWLANTGPPRNCYRALWNQGQSAPKVTGTTDMLCVTRGLCQGRDREPFWPREPWNLHNLIIFPWEPCNIL